MVLAACLLLVALGIGAFLVWAVMSLGTCGGDGGSPYAVPGSQRAHYCDRHLAGITVAAGWFTALFGGVGSVSRASWEWLVFLGGLGALIIVSPLLVGPTLSN